MASNFAGFGAATNNMGSRMGGDQWGSGGGYTGSPSVSFGSDTGGAGSDPYAMSPYLAASAKNMLSSAQGAFATAGNGIPNPYTEDVANMQAGVGRENVAATYGGKKRGLLAAHAAGRLSDGQFQSLMGQLGRDSSAESASQTREPMIEQAKAAQSFDLQAQQLAQQKQAQMFSGYNALLSILRTPLPVQVGHGGGGGDGGGSSPVRTQWNQAGVGGGQLF